MHMHLQSKSTAAPQAAAARLQTNTRTPAFQAAFTCSTAHRGEVVFLLLLCCFGAESTLLCYGVDEDIQLVVQCLLSWSGRATCPCAVFSARSLPSLTSVDDGLFQPPLDGLQNNTTSRIKRNNQNNQTTKSNAP